MSISPTASKVNKSEWVSKLINAGLAQACFADGVAAIKNQTTFKNALEQGAKQWVPTSMELEAALVTAFKHRDSVLALINKLTVDSIAVDLAIEDIKAQIYRLFEPSFLSYTPLSTLKQYPRYLRAIESRIERLNFASKTISEEMALEAIQKNLNEKVNSLSHPNLDLDYVFIATPKLVEFSRMIEEWRVSIFAQHLRTQMPVSEKRLLKFWAEHIEIE